MLARAAENTLEATTEPHLALNRTPQDTEVKLLQGDGLPLSAKRG
ncbi:hypothetical protein ACVW0W_003206 [Bradyrhizobium sp. USDA 4469]